MLSAPGTAGLQLQIKYHVVLFRKFQYFLEGRDALSGILASEPRAGVQPAQRGKRLIVHFSLPVGGAVHGVVVDGDKARVTGKLQVGFDKRGSQSHSFLESGERIFRGVPGGSAMPDDQHLVSLSRSIILPPALSRSKGRSPP